MIKMFYSNPELSKAAKLSLPTLFAYFPLGVVFGIVFTHLNFPWYLAPIMSAFVFGGTVQFVSLSMITAHNTIAAILFTTVFVALRNSFYGLSLLKRFEVPLPLKTFLIFSVADATYAIMMLNPPEPGLNDRKFCFYLSLLNYLYWVVGSFVGAACGSWIPNFSGLSFILPCFFMVLVIENFLVLRSITPLIMPMVFSILAYVIFPKNYFLLAVIASVVFIAVAHHKKEKTL